ncbi:isocitrate lyase/PEP mutase family protein [Nocardia alni]|uniref:isocitrate lyase/PEP mutase family protein n=1 Tax=Nocardia alni TaxID=2815723 RepID=UPI001C230942|nr:isocitrate lyase/PEP mutase family protein [Nocardia alni]
MRLDELLAGPDPILAPGVYDGLSARIAEQAGFGAVYLSGGAVARSAGVPDLGLLSMTEVRDRTAQICSVVGVPVIADIDTGYGNALNVFRTVGEFVRIGVSALQLEDQLTPKKCGHYGGKELIDADEMVGKITAAADAIGDAPVRIIARTDAIAVEGLDAALDRARRYADAGAHILFVEAPEDRDQIERIAAQLRGIPLLLNMFEGGRTPRVPLPELAEMGYRIVIVPSDLQRAAMRAMQEAAAEIFAHGDSHAMADRLASFDERDQLVDKESWDRRERRAGQGIDGAGVTG